VIGQIAGPDFDVTGLIRRGYMLEGHRVVKSGQRPESRRRPRPRRENERLDIWHHGPEELSHNVEGSYYYVILRRNDGLVVLVE
jgi:hypothetical protein